MSAEFQVLQVTWESHAPQLTAIRQEVFVEEQEVDPAFEWDEIDAVAVHLLAISGDQPVGCARIIDFKKIGRMAVVKPWRGCGVGQALLTKAVAICQAQGTPVVKLTAQTHAISFYEQAGFEATSGIYQDANIPHVDMQLQLAK
ncbi:MAG: GNAT family N-acetyltransferase [Methylotenera sp.]|nr:MAG: GNAT family N-acetyltransferase [Methylotenera sp.]